MTHQLVLHHSTMRAGHSQPPQPRWAMRLVGLPVLRLMVAVLLILEVPLTTEALATSSSSSSPSPWAPATWTIELNLGREPGTWMSEAYGASGGRVVATPITIQATADTVPESQDGFCGPGGSSRIIPQSSGTYINMQGQQQVTFSTPGGWTLEFPPSSLSSSSGGRRKNKGLASTLRFWMDLETKVERNDVVLEAGERLYFSTKVWREDDYTAGLIQMRPIFQQYRQAQQVLEAQVSHDSGDRRLDGTDALETIQAYGKVAQLVLDRDAKRQAWKQALDRYPPVGTSDPNHGDDGGGSGGDENNSSASTDASLLQNNNNNVKAVDLPEGPWPGAEEWVSMKNRNNPILVKRKSKTFGVGDEYHIVGRWTATPVLAEGEYELV